MSVKGFLKQVQYMDYTLKNYEERLQNLKRDIVRLKAPTVGMKVQNNKVPELADIIQLIEDVEEQTNRKYMETMRIKSRAEELINHEKDYLKYNILYARYINGKSWDKIAEETNFSKASVWRTHGEALQDLENILLNKKLDSF